MFPCNFSIWCSLLTPLEKGPLSYLQLTNVRVFLLLISNDALQQFVVEGGAEVEAELGIASWGRSGV